MKPFGRSRTDFGPSFTAAEQSLLRNCQLGRPTRLASQRPKLRNASHAIRGELVRFLALGGDESAPVHEKGLDLEGAWIDGELNLEGASIATPLVLQNCRFEQELVLRAAVFAIALDLSGSYVPGIRGDGLVCRGDLFLGGGFEAFARVSLKGSTVAGDIDFTKAALRDHPEGALHLSGSEVGGSVYFRKCQFEGPVYLVGAHVCRDIDCADAQFIGTWKDGAQGFSLFLSRARVDGELSFIRTHVSGVNLADARVGLLRDEGDTWGERITLNGFDYKAIAHGSPTGWKMRHHWLKQQKPEHFGQRDHLDKFCPQPWQHLIRVLQSSGHREDAIEIGMQYEAHLRSIGKIGARAEDSKGHTKFERSVLSGAHSLFGLVAGYGYRPMRVVYWILGVWLGCAVLYWWAAIEGVFGPSNPLIFEAPAYAHCSSGGSDPSRNWYRCIDLKGEYSTFSPWAYSLDVLLPVVNLRQEDSWGPIIPSPSTVAIPGGLVRFVIWVENLFGWVCSLLLVATISGFARRRE